MPKHSRRCTDAGTRAWWPLAAVLLSSCAAHAGNVDVVFLDSFEDGCGNVTYSEPFALGDNSAWPPPWSALGNVQTADVQQQMARLQPNATAYSLARMGAAISNSNVEARFTLRFEDTSTQGIGFYVRQNNGYLAASVPHGQGYAVFVENFRDPPGISLWREVDGEEQQVVPTFAATLAAGMDYRVRFQVVQTAPAQTQLRAKIWLSGEAEPTAWQITTLDPTPALQNISGGIAVDSWSSRTVAPIAAHTFVDNLELISLCVP